jgi:hypothetical protein
MYNERFSLILCYTASKLIGTMQGAVLYLQLGLRRVDCAALVRLRMRRRQQLFLARTQLLIPLQESVVLLHHVRKQLRHGGNRARVGRRRESESLVSDVVNLS